MAHSHKTRTAAALQSVSLILLVSGCKAREMGVQFADTQAVKVDDTWISAARSCWPELARNNYTRGILSHELADPLHFRATFAAYAALGDKDIEAIVAAPINTAPAPDSGSLRGAGGGLLTRNQAVSFDGNPPGNLASNRIPSDALCAIHPGVPVGF